MLWSCEQWGSLVAQSWILWTSELWASLVAQLVKNLPAILETWLWSLGWEDPLEKGATTHSSILAWRIPQTVQSMGSQRVRHDWATFTSLHHAIVLYRCESWIMKKAECPKMDDFDLWCLRRFLGVLWTIRLIQSILKEINPEYSLEGLLLKL